MPKQKKKKEPKITINVSVQENPNELKQIIESATLLKPEIPKSFLQRRRERLNK